MRHRSGVTTRRGAVGLELLITIVLGGLILVLAAGWLERQQRVVSATVGRSETASVLARTPRVLSGELHAGVEQRDWGLSGDSVLLRAFRGRALVCRAQGASLWVGYRGDRNLDPAKDSVLVLDRNARWSVAHVRSVRRSGSLCHGLPSQTWRLDRSVQAPTVLRVFERGVYSIAGGALRYRRGRGGRQPLTYARLDSLSTLGRGVGGGVVVDLRGRAAPVGSPGLERRRTLRSRAP